PSVHEEPPDRLRRQQIGVGQQVGEGDGLQQAQAYQPLAQFGRDVAHAVVLHHLDRWRLLRDELRHRLVEPRDVAPHRPPPATFVAAASASTAAACSATWSTRTASTWPSTPA